MTTRPAAAEGDSFRGEALPPSVASAVSARAAESIELAALLQRCGQSDQEAFGELYDRTCTRVYGLVLRILHDPGYAEETTQEVYLQAWRTAASFDSEKGSALAWLMTLAHRRAVDRVRAEQAHTQREVTYGTRALGNDFDEVTEEVERKLEQQAVLDCLELLTDTQREAISLAYYGGRTYAEVASHLDVGLPTVKSRIRDGLTRLKKSLGVT